MRFSRKFLVVLTAIGICAPAMFARQASPSQGSTVTVTVTATAKDQTQPPAVPANAVVVKEDGKVSKVVSWEPMTGARAGLDLAVLIDDSVSEKASVQLKSIGGFLRTLPADSRVAVAYANFGAANYQQEFTTDHEKAAGAIRIPNAGPESANGVYDSLGDLIKKWPATEGRKVVLFVTDGIDVTDGVGDSDPGRSIVLKKAIESAQRAGVVVYTIYASGAGRALQNSVLVNNGQGSLRRLAAETGGDAFFAGLQTPVSFQPFLQNVQKMLGQQYMLTFVAAPREKGRYEHLQVTAEANGVELTAPDHVYISGGTR
jgi:VWFA-related protein